MQPTGVNVVGSANMDLVVRAPRFPAPGETILGGSFATFPGGKGANQAVAIGKLGGNPLFIGAVGDDGFGQELLLSLGAAGVRTSEVWRHPEVPTGVALITVDSTGQNMIIVASGANMTLDIHHVRAAMQRNPCRVLLSQLETPLDCIQAAASVHEGLFVLNPAPACVLPKSLLERVDVLTPNEREFEQLSGVPGLDDAGIMEGAKRIVAKHVVITLGAQGCAWMHDGVLKRFAAPRVEAKDTTAAGDAFSGALAHYLSLDHSMEDAIPQAIRFASISVTREGAQASMPFASDLA